jgi:hypothetical protein
MDYCEICPNGFYCLPVAFGDTQPGYFDCPAGFYCPNGTGLDWMPCPAGTYSNQLNLYKVSGPPMTAYGFLVCIPLIKES